MDKFLAEIYGTNRTADAADVEKLAAAALENELTQDGSQMDLSQISDDQVEELAQQYLAQAEQGEQAAQGDEPQDEEAMAKFAEADHLGRVMAHSMWQEMGVIQKEAADKRDIRAAAESKGISFAKAEQLLSGRGAAEAPKDVPLNATMRNVAHNAKDKVVGAGKAAWGFAKAHPKSTIGTGAGAGALALGLGLHKALKKNDAPVKQASALDTLAEVRAMQILEASGIDPATLQAQEKTSSADANEVLAAAVDNRAWEILSQYGVVPSQG